MTRFLSSLPLAAAILFASARNAGSSIEPSNIDLAHEVHTLAARLDDATEANRELTVAIDEWRREMVSKGLREDQDRSDLIAAIDRMTKAFRESR